MYQNIYYCRSTKTIHLWDDEKGYRKFPFQHYGYIKDPKGTLITLDGHKVKKVTGWSAEDEANGNIYESDLNPETRTLIDLYYESDNMSVNHNEMFFDIEVSMEGGYALSTEATNEITAITYYLKTTKQYTTFLLDKDNKITPYKKAGHILMTFQTEKGLLKSFIDEFQKAKPTIISGWNSEQFDIPYICNRIERIFNRKTLQSLSPIGKVTYNEREETFNIAGITHWDYMLLYKKFTYNEEASYSLDAISKKELNRGKLVYEGTLQELYENDVNTFIDYNIEDVRLILEIDNKLAFIDTGKNICHKGHVSYNNLFFVSSVLDGASLTYTKKVGIIAPNKKKKIKLKLQRNHSAGEKKIYFDNDLPKRFPKKAFLKIWKNRSSAIDVEYIEWKDNYVILEEELEENLLTKYEVKLSLVGAYIRDPIPGKYKWIFDLDLTSMYPFLIISLNISPETKVGKILNWAPEDYIKRIDKIYTIYIKGKKDELNKDELEELFLKEQYSVASNGVLYNTHNKGLIPTILELWFQERSEYKDLMKKYKKEGNKELTLFYHLKQLTAKVLLNSFYGVMALESFRFFDIENAEAVTISGQNLIKFSVRAGNAYYNKVLKPETYIDYNIYVDTDSCFFSALPIIQKLYQEVDINNIEEMVKYTLKIAGKTQDYINKSYDVYAQKFLNLSTHKFFIKQENVAKAGFWQAKKRYAQLIVNEEGVMIEKLDIKGMDVVRSDFSPAFRIFMKQMLWDILNDLEQLEITTKIIEFKKSLSEKNIVEIMAGSSVKKISEYDDPERPIFRTYKGTPVHGKAALMYNDILGYLKETQYQPIINGDKVKWIYLKKNPLNIDVLAIRGTNDPIKVMNFINKYIDYEKTFEKRILNKFQAYYDSLGWGTIILNEYASKFFEF